MAGELVRRSEFAMSDNTHMKDNVVPCIGHHKVVTSTLASCTLSSPRQYLTSAFPYHPTTSWTVHGAEVQQQSICHWQPTIALPVDWRISASSARQLLRAPRTRPFMATALLLHFEACSLASSSVLDGCDQSLDQRLPGAEGSII